jgi:hypothetical protein
LFENHISSLHLSAIISKKGISLKSLCLTQKNFEKINLSENHLIQPEKNFE